MKIRDIVNRELVNLTNCDQEPIHIPGSIQPHGFLLGINHQSFEVSFCSGNVEEFTGVSYQKLLGKNSTEIFGSDFLSMLQSCTSLAPGQFKNFKAGLLEKEFEFAAHLSNETIVLESEPVTQKVPQDGDLFSWSRQLLGYMEEAHTLVQLCSKVAGGIRRITGYDRVMVYRFDRDYNGEVIAEDKRQDLESFLGLHYPHTDIPVQARELYIKNLLRVIVDVHYVPVPLYTQDDGSQKNLDLSYSALRSVSPIHIQYLQNMGVGATLTISLIHKNKLWGLIACHHYSPKQLTLEVRLAARLQGHFITSQIDMRQANEDFETVGKVTAALETFTIGKFDMKRESLQQMVQDPNMLKLCNANGAAIIVDGKIYAAGTTPREHHLQSLCTLLSQRAQNGFFFTDTLTKNFAELQAVSEVTPGIVYFSLGKLTDNCVMWFRTETISEVTWAGDPNKAIEKDAGGLSPRKSFEQWKETVKFKSKPWIEAELRSASNFVNMLQKHITGILLSEEEEKQRALVQTLAETNAELENINWISTHDFQEPLRKIQLLSSYVLSGDEPQISPDIYRKVDRINAAAQHMQNLIRDILKYTKLNYGHDKFERVSLNEVVTDVLKELEEPVRSANAKVVVSELPIIYCIPFLVRQLFTNLLYNSLKFASADRAPVISISVGLAEPSGHGGQFYKIQYADNGIGFDEQYNEQIFKIFTRLHNINDYPGSGIGLALCKKIMTTHHGYIRAEGKPGHGATFLLYFPVKAE